MEVKKPTFLQGTYEAQISEPKLDLLCMKISKIFFVCFYSRENYASLQYATYLQFHLNSFIPSHQIAAPVLV